MLLTTLSGLAAAIGASSALGLWFRLVILTHACLRAGGLIVVVAGVPTDATLGHMLSFASGIMMYISYCDLLTHAQLELDSMFWANVWVRLAVAYACLPRRHRCCC